MDKKKIAKIFIIVSILFIGILCAIYGYRLIHYYRLEHPKVKGGKQEEVLLGTKIVTSSNIVTSGDGLYQDEDFYYYYGLVENNYIYYSGILWRIVRINEDESITLISGSPVTSMVFGYEPTQFKDSYVYEWLNDTFYSQLVQANDYLIDTSYCVDAVVEADDVRCDTEEKSKVGMISVFEYLKASGSKGYLNGGKSYWTTSPNMNSKIWFINQKGLVTSESMSGESYYSYGVRPMITIKSDVKIASGTGTESDPYKIETSVGTTLGEQTIGSYIRYSDQTWRKVGTEDLGTKIVLDGYLNVNDEEIEMEFSDGSNLYSIKNKKNIGYYLNSTYYNLLQNKEYLVEYPWNIFYYNSSQKYNYKVDSVDTVKTEVGLLGVTDLFITDYSNYALITSSNEDDGTIFMVQDDGRLYANMVTEELKVRPAVVLKNELKIVSGSGTKEDPFVVGE